jgi:hypothetical protein
MNTEGYVKMVSYRGMANAQNTNKLIVSERSKWYGIGKMLAKKYDISKYQRADLFIKATQRFSEIIICFREDGTYKMQTSYKNFGFRTNTPFSFCKELGGIYELKEVEENDNELCLYFCWEKRYK